MLTITQIESDPTKKKEIDLIDVLRSFGALCVFADVDPLPKSSIKSFGRAGPWKAYDTYHKVATIVAALKGEAEVKSKDVTIPCTVACYRLSSTVRLDDAFDRQFGDREALHLVFQLRDDWEFRVGSMRTTSALLSRTLASS